MRTPFRVEGRVAGLLRLLTIVSLLAIVPLAHASPPDQTWIAGLYDDADHDDVVALVTDGTGDQVATAATSPPVAYTSPALVPALPERAARQPSGFIRFRAPPQV